MEFIRAFLGALIVWIIIPLSRSKNYFIAGLVPLFPVFGLIAHVIVYGQTGVAGVKETALFGMFALLPYLAYLGGMFISLRHLSFYRSMALSVVVWLVVSVALINIWQRVVHT
jgi:membrane protein GlpM